MGLLRWAEVRFDAHMQLRGSRREPASSATSKSRGLSDFLHAENVSIKSSRAVLSSGRHGYLYVIERKNLPVVLFVRLIHSYALGG